VNAFLGSYGKVTQYMGPTNREAKLERMAFRYTRRLDATMPNLLWGMLIRTQKEQAQVAKELGEKERELRAMGATRYPGDANGQVSSPIVTNPEERLLQLVAPQAPVVPMARCAGKRQPQA
jgi:hypothetical protein